MVALRLQKLIDFYLIHGNTLKETLFAKRFNTLTKIECLWVINLVFNLFLQTHILQVFLNIDQ